MALYEITSEPVPLDFECTLTSDMTLRTLQNAKNLLMCRMGEVPYDRQRGLDPALFDLPIDELQGALLPELDRAMLWEPDVEVVNATAEIADGVTVIRCVVEIKTE